MLRSRFSSWKRCCLRCFGLCRCYNVRWRGGHSANYAKCGKSNNMATLLFDSSNRPQIWTKTLPQVFAKLVLLCRCPSCRPSWFAALLSIFRKPDLAWLPGERVALGLLNPWASDFWSALTKDSCVEKAVIKVKLTSCELRLQETQTILPASGTHVDVFFVFGEAPVTVWMFIWQFEVYVEVPTSKSSKIPRWRPKSMKRKMLQQPSSRRAAAWIQNMAREDFVASVTVRQRWVVHGTCTDVCDVCRLMVEADVFMLEPTWTNLNQLEPTWTNLNHSKKLGRLCIGIGSLQKARVFGWFKGFVQQIPVASCSDLSKLWSCQVATVQQWRFPDFPDWKHIFNILKHF